MKSVTKIVIGLAILVTVFLLLFITGRPKERPKSFAECVALGYPILESYPRRCNAGEEIFTENIGNALEKQNLIVLSSPIPNETIQSPLRLVGQARGNWYFEASFPVVLLDGGGREIVSGFATAQGEWMTMEFVPFTAEFSFTKPTTSTGTLILKKDNPSGLPKHDDELIVPVYFVQ